MTQQKTIVFFQINVLVNKKGKLKMIWLFYFLRGADILGRLVLFFLFKQEKSRGIQF